MIDEVRRPIVSCFIDELHDLDSLHVHHLSLLALIAVASCSASDDVPAPMITSVFPTTAAVGTSVVMSGSYFCQQPAPDEGEEIDPLACASIGSVQFGALPANLGQYSDSSITVEVPDLAPGPIRLHLSVAGRTSNSVGFTVE